MPSRGMLSVRARRDVCGENDRTSGCIRIYIEDNGAGISEDQRTHIFDPFFTTKSFGTGLGLPAALNAVKQHGGNIPGRFAVFPTAFAKR